MSANGPVSVTQNFQSGDVHIVVVDPYKGNPTYRMTLTAYAAIKLYHELRKLLG